MKDKPQTKVKNFRVWDLDQKLFVYFDFEDVRGTNSLYNSKENYNYVWGHTYDIQARHTYYNHKLTRITNTKNVIQRFTELFDCKKNPIYEGDLVKFRRGVGDGHPPDYRYLLNCEVKYLISIGCYIMDAGNYHGQFQFQDAIRVKIISNIFETIKNKL